MAPDTPKQPGGEPGDEPAARYDGPYCGVCNYPLEGLVDSSRCPECGGAFVEVLRWPLGSGAVPGPAQGRRYVSDVMHNGRPLIHVAFGPGPEGPVGKARGFVAVGDDAKGFIAIGGSAKGVVAVGGGAVGVFAFGGGAAGAVFAAGGGALGGVFAVGGGALSVGGAVAGGGFAVLASLSGLGLRSPVGLPAWETLAATGGAAAAGLLGTLLYAAVVVLTKLRPSGGDPYRRESVGSDH